LLRRGNLTEYWPNLADAWRFLGGDSAGAEARARLVSVSLLRRVLAFDARALLLPADPAHARYAVVRSTFSGFEGFLVDRAILRAWTVLEDDDALRFARMLLQLGEPRTQPDDAPVVLRWFGAQRPPTRFVYLPDDDPQAAADLIESAVLDLMAREA
jgi:hypothetical protein